MELFILVISDTTKDWGQVDTFAFMDLASAQIKMMEYYKYGCSLAQGKTEDIYQDNNSFDIIYNDNTKYFGQIKKEIL